MYPDWAEAKSSNNMYCCPCWLRGYRAHTWLHTDRKYSRNKFWSSSSPFQWSALWDSSWWWQPAPSHQWQSGQQHQAACAELCNRCGCWKRQHKHKDIFSIQHCIWAWTRKDVYLAGNCSVLRFQPFAVIALDRRNISKSSEPKATTDTSGSPSTTTPLILWILPKKQ